MNRSFRNMVTRSSFQRLPHLTVFFLGLCFAEFYGPAPVGAEPSVDPQFRLARVRYSGGGDWYGNESSWINLLKALGLRTSLTTARREAVVSLNSNEIFYYPLITLSGHGRVWFSSGEAEKLRQYLMGGGFLFADDDFGMDESFRQGMKLVFPDKDFVEIPKDHEIFKTFYKLDGIPKIHEHHGGPPQALGLFHEGRLVVFYSFNTDIGDSLEEPGIHQDSPEIRETGLQMAINVVLYALTH